MNEEKNIERTSVSNNWQTVVPKTARWLLGLEKGNKLQWVQRGRDIIVRRVEK